MIDEEVRNLGLVNERKMSDSKSVKDLQKLVGKNKVAPILTKQNEDNL